MIFTEEFMNKIRFAWFALYFFYWLLIGKIQQLIGKIVTSENKYHNWMKKHIVFKEDNIYEKEKTSS